jgi:hypothetical protein
VAFKAHHECPDGLPAPLLHLEDHCVAALDQSASDAHSGTGSAARSNSGMVPGPSNVRHAAASQSDRAQPPNERHVQGLERRERGRLVRPIADTHAWHACEPGHLQVVRGVANHQRALWRTPSSAISSCSISGCGLTAGFVGGAGGVEHALAAATVCSASSAHAGSCRWHSPGCDCAPSAPAASAACPRTGTRSCCRSRRNGAVALHQLGVALGARPGAACLQARRCRPKPIT